MTIRTRHTRFLGRFLRGLGFLLVRVFRGIVALTGLGGLLVGVPWGLIHFIGWPLPDHWPSLEEVTSWVHLTYTTDRILDALAIAAWIVWVLFLLDVLVSIADAARGLRWPDVELPSGPLRTPAAALVGWLVFALLGPRTPDAAPALVVPLDGAITPVVATAPQHPGTTNHDAGPPEAIVRHPEDGVHDSLWRIAERHLGDGIRWSDIWHLNKDRVQNDGRVFTNPHLIQPGWRLALPDTEERVVQPEPPAEPPSSTPGQPDNDTAAGSRDAAGEPRATESSTPTPTPADAAADDAEPSSDGPGIDLGRGVFLSLTVAAAISAALLVARRRYRRFWVPGRSSHDPMPVAPVVYELRLAHLAATHPDDDNDDGDPDPNNTGHTAPAAPAVTEPLATTPPVVAEEVTLGVRDGLPVASRLTRRGLGLVGPGTDPAARALLVALLTSEATQVVVPLDDLPRLVGDDPDQLPTTLRVVPDLDTALALLDPTTRNDGDPARRILVASPPATPADTARLGAILAPGTSAAAAVLLGQYPGASVYVDDDGTVTATNPGPAEALRGTRLFTATAPATADLLDLLAAADPNLPPRRPPDRPAEDRNRVGLSADAADGQRDQAASAQPPPVNPSAEHEGDTTEPMIVERAQRTDTPGTALRLTVLGPFTAALTPPDGATSPVQLGRKAQELLTYLAIHRGGVGRDTLVADVWRDAARGPRRTNNLNSALRRLRDALAAAAPGEQPDVVLVEDNRVTLNDKVVRVDYWELDDARTAARTATTDQQRRDAYQRLVDAYGGRLGADLADAEWANGPAYTTQCAVVDAIGRLAADAEPSDPQRALDLVETARGFDPTNETLYTTILRLQAQLGYHDAIERTLSLLSTELAAHKDRPSPEIDGLARSLRRRYTTETATGTNGATARRNGQQSSTESARNARPARDHDVK